jgi:threonine/homoserine/homoserine lactone efflux protein
MGTCYLVYLAYSMRQTEPSMKQKVDSVMTRFYCVLKVTLMNWWHY